MSRARWVVPLLLLAGACGGKAGKNASEGVGGASGASGSPAVMEPTCADTLRSAEDEAENAKVLEMAADGDPEQLVPLLVQLVQVETTGEVTPESLSKQYEPYQAPIAAKLTEWGAQNIERFWIINSIAASVPLKYVDDLLCLPNVLNVHTDTAYWEVVARPWSPDEAGKYECPLEGAQCPEHCFDFEGTPFDEAAGCYQYPARERVACAITGQVIFDGAASCFEQIATGKTYLFYSFVPIEPNFIGWRPCDPARTIHLCGL